MSDQLKASLADIEKRLAELSAKTNTIGSRRSSVLEAVGRQQTDVASAKTDIEHVVTKALLDIEVLSRHQSGGDGGSTFGPP